MKEVNLYMDFLSFPPFHEEAAGLKERILRTASYVDGPDQALELRGFECRWTYQ